MEVNKLLVILAIIVLIITGTIYTIQVVTNKTDASPTTQIVVNGNGSSGTGNVTTTTQVTQKVVTVQSGDNNKADTTPKVSTPTYATTADPYEKG